MNKQKYVPPIVSAATPQNGLPTCLAVGAVSAVGAAAAVAIGKMVGDINTFSKQASLKLVEKTNYE
ncbi:hypothetical protein [Desulfovibrio sp. JC010]|uniref:hypothetical protein n=1 Tax=Desulfovibrio sp. JC010 TaxID=2593641 RepID=UPI0013D18086|nr:hypothetical protein [Desulfovibrio sp. JC010]NDV25980.1 hypothetical protein [Desulfovibrio sp. JC010]